MEEKTIYLSNKLKSDANKGRDDIKIIYFKKLYMKKKKIIDFFNNFYISHRIDIKTFLK